MSGIDERTTAATSRSQFSSAQTVSAGAGIAVAGAGPAPTSAPVRAETAPAAVAARRSGTRRFLILVPLSLLVIVLIVGGYYALRLRDVFTTINAVSTPAASISAEALGGSGNVQIDTAPARAAVESGEVAPAALSEPAAGSDPDQDAPAAIAADATKVPEEAEQPVSTAPTQESEPVDDEEFVPAVATKASTAEPTTEPIVVAPTESAANEEGDVLVASESTPTATLEEEPRRVVLSELERVQNGSFEDGDDAWYLEEGAEPTSDEARTGDLSLGFWTNAAYADQAVFFIAGTTYQVSGWGKLLGSDTYADFGVIYYDEAGTRLTGLEPEPVQFTESRWKKLTFDFTPPEEAASVKVFLWKPENGSRFFADDISVRSIVPEDVVDAEVTETAEGIITILVMGVDAREGEAIDIGVRPDSLSVVQLNADTGSCRMLAIPRDTRTELPGYGMSKINHALAVGGIEYQKQVVEGLLDLRIDHYVLIDFSGFEDLVDAVGGITVDVPADFLSSDGTQFYAGTQAMDGRRALSYARWRGDATGDFGRIERQQQILRALVSKATELNIVRSVNELLPAVEQNLRTDLSPTDMIAIGRDFQSRCTDETVLMVNLEGSAATYDDPLLQLPLYYIEVDEAEIRRKVAALLEP